MHRRLPKLLRTPQGPAAPPPTQAEERTLQAELAGAQARAHEALCDNINTAGAMAALCDLVKATNIYLAARADAAGALLCGANTQRVL